jgi:hypothetical protein
MEVFENMKKIISLCIALVTVFSCYEYDDSAIWDHIEKTERLAETEYLCNQVNANIAALHSILNAVKEEDNVTNLVRIMDGGEYAGYQITFSGSTSVPLYTEFRMKNVNMPDLSVKQDDDGTFYWTLYSAWLYDEDGNRLSEPPRLKVEDEHWYLSTDKGTNWELLHPVAFDSGDDVLPSPSFLFESVYVADNGNVNIKLCEGTVLTFHVWKENVYDPWDGYLDPDVYQEQDIINLTNVLMAQMGGCNTATRQIMEIAYNFWKRRGEFIYCSNTSLDRPWDYWSYVGYVDGNTGFSVSEGHGGYKRIDCSTFVRYVTNGIDYYSTPYFNALEWTEVKQGALSSSGTESSTSDKTVCRSGKIYLRYGRKHILESSNSNKYKFTKVFAYDNSGKVVKTLTGKTEFVVPEGAEYIRVEMKVQSASDYKAAVKGVSPAAILKCLRIRENEVLDVGAGCPVSERRANAMSRWFDENGYGLEAHKDYNPLCWEDSDFKPGTIVFMGKKSAKSEYKGITHVTLYIGGGYIIHSQAPRGLLGGEGIMIDKLKDMELRYDRPFCAAASPSYHLNWD